MDAPEELYFVVGFLTGYLFWGIELFFWGYYCRKSKHICSDCKAWSCQGKYCDYKRKQKQVGGVDDGQT